MGEKKNERKGNKKTNPIRDYVKLKFEEQNKPFEIK